MTISRPATWALFPWVCARPEQLTAANVAGSLAESLGLLLGPAVGAGLIALSGPGLAFGAMAGVMALVTVAAVVLQVHHAPSAAPDRMTIGDVGREVIAGIRVVGSTGSGTVVAFMGLGFVLLGAVDVGAVIAATEVLERSESVAGLLTTASGFGAVVGAMASVLLVGRARLITPMLSAAALAGIPFALAASSNVLALTLGFFALNGIGAQAMETIGKTMTQRSTSDDVLARVFGLVESLTMLAMALGAAVIALLAAWVGARQAMVVSGLSVPAVAALMARSLAAIDRATVPPDGERIDALQGVAMFEPLALPVIEQLALNMEPIEAPAGATLFTQGDVADHVTVISGGEVEIRRDGRSVAFCGPGEHVGEVGVLRGRPRNATVLAHTAVSGWTIDRTVFLEAVTGHPQSLAAAESVTTAREP